MLGPGLCKDAGAGGSYTQACADLSREAPSPLWPCWVGALGSPSRVPATVGTMGQCGITSSKTVLVFLNLIFWVSGAGGRRRVGAPGDEAWGEACERFGGDCSSDLGSGATGPTTEGRLCEIPPRPCAWRARKGPLGASGGLGVRASVLGCLWAGGFTRRGFPWKQPARQRALGADSFRTSGWKEDIYSPKGQAPLSLSA